MSCRLTVLAAGIHKRMRSYFLYVPDVPSRPEIVHQRWHLDVVEFHESDALDRAKIDVLKDYIRDFQSPLSAMR